MSSLIVEVCAVEEIQPHPNADRLEKIRVKNWWCIAPIGQYKVGDKCVYVPPDSILPEELANKWGIAKYLAPLPRDLLGVRPTGLRVRASRFRGEKSSGTIQPLDDPNWSVGHNVLEHYGITKYEPPVKSHAGDTAPDVETFHKYTEIENLGNFPCVFQDGKEVVIDEKCHGSNLRLGFIFHEDKWQFMGGSHHNRRKEFDNKGNKSVYWLPFKDENVVNLLKHVCDEKHNVIIYFELIGPGVQDMHYGQSIKSFRAFDISVGGNYLDYDEKKDLFAKFGIEMVPFIYRGPFSMGKIEELVDGPTLVCDPDEIDQPFKGREGIVIRPVKEAFSPDLSGRKILKYVSVDYHDRKNKKKTEHH